jgi:arabinogalactan oligomer / maltooligosaccharide transport system permease protein
MRDSWLTRALLHVALVTAAAVVLYPLLWVVKIALTGDPGFDLFGPAPVSFAAFSALGAKGFVRALGMSTLVSLLATVLGLGLATTAAFVLSRLDVRGRALGIRALLVTQMFPSLLMSVPLYLLLDKLGLLGSLAGLVLVYATVSVPFSAWMLKGFFDALPVSLDEAAILDGASEWQLFWHIGLPLVRPGIAVTGLYSFMGAWNEYILAATFLNDDSRYTAPVLLKNMVGAYGAEWGPFAAGSLIVSLPVVIIFFVLQRHLVRGLMQGGVKE